MSSLRLAINGVDPALTLKPLAMLGGDPTLLIESNRAARATWTPQGPAACVVRWQPGEPEALIDTYGPGRSWLAERAPGLVGLRDDISGFDPPPGAVRHLWARFRGDRVAATGTLWHDLAWIITQQRVRRIDAARQWRALVTTFGEPAPGVPGLTTPPAPAALARTSLGSLRSLGFDESRARTLITTARVADRLHALVAEPADEALAKISSLRGIGQWTTGCLRAFTWGDPDAVILGDSGIPSLIASSLTRERWADDARMIELLEPYRPHRYRVLRLVFAARTNVGGHRK